MTPRISLVAVCCSRASAIRVALFEFLEQSHVLDGDDGLVGEGLEKRDLFVSKGRTSVRRTPIAPIATPSRSSGVAAQYECL